MVLRWMVLDTGKLEIRRDESPKTRKADYLNTLAVVMALRGTVQDTGSLEIRHNDSPKIRTAPSLDVLVQEW